MAKRSTNTQQGRRGQSQAQAQAGRRLQSHLGEPEAEPRQLPTAVHDIIGVGLVVVAIAMLISLISPTEAPVTRALGEAMQLGFGEGAWLVPVSLFVYAISFFLSRSDDKNTLVPNRIAAGLALIVIALLSILSCVAPYGTQLTNLFEPVIAKNAGGFVGGGIAWALLSSLGKQVALVVLAGIVVVGIVVCGFSITEMVQRLQGRLEETRARHAEAAAAKAFEDPAARGFGGAARGFNEHAVANDAYSAEPATTYIGGRKTSVLKRGNQEAAETKKLNRRQAQTLVATEVPSSGQTARLDLDSALEDEGFSAPSHMPINPDEFGTLSAQGAATADPHEKKTSFLSRHFFKKGAEQAESRDAEASDVAGAAGVAGVTAAAGGVAAGVAAGAAEPAIPAFLQNAASKTAGQEDRSKLKPTKRGDAEPRTKRAGQSSQAAATSTTSKGSQAKTKKATTPAGPVSAREVPGRDESLPPMSILQANGNVGKTVSSNELATTAQTLQKTLDDFGVSSTVVGWTSGPSVTTFQIEMGEGERVNKILNLEADIALGLAARAVRIFAPIPGTSYVGIEIPNKHTQAVYLGDVLPDVKGGPLQAAFGRDSDGKPVVVDIAALPHLLVAGTTGSGKSVLLNSIVMSMLMRATPEQLRLIMVDPKRVEFTFYAGLPHLYVPVVTEPRQAASALQWSVTEMERRLKIFEHYKVRDIGSFNRAIDSGKLADMENPPDKMPFFVIVIDELSDLMMVAGKDVEASIVRIAQLGRAAGIHLIVATQRPSADVVTGLIKANIDNRVALSVDNNTNSRIILDQSGAEKLLGKGDMLCKLRGKSPKRAQACFVSEAEVEATVTFIKEHHESDYHEDILSAVTPGTPGGPGAPADLEPGDDPRIWEAAEIVIESGMGSTSGLQRRMRVGFSRAGRLMDLLEQKGVVGPQNGSKPRDVLIDAEGLEELRQATAEYKEV